MKVIELFLDQVKVGERFRKDLGDIEELAASIKEHGLLQPITVSEEFDLLAGGRRLYAARLAGLITIPVVVRSIEGEGDAREIELVENIHRKDLTWQERCSLELRIYKIKGDVRSTAEVLGAGKSQTAEMIRLAEAVEAIPELGIYKTPSDALKALAKMQERMVVGELRRRTEEEIKKAPGSEAARLFTLADNHYKIGDALEGMQSIAGGVFHFAEVDPPYGIGLDEKKRSSSEVRSTDDVYTEVEEGEYAPFLRPVAAEVFRILEPSAFCVWWFGYQHFTTVLEALTEVGFQVSPIPCIWNKGAQGQTNRPNIHLASCHEPFFIARKGTPYIAKQGRSNVFSFDPLPGASKIHPTERPLPLMEEILATFTYPRARILVPFLGSGNTLIAAYRMGCVGVGWDLEQSLKDNFLLRVKAEATRREGKDDGRLHSDIVS